MIQTLLPSKELLKIICTSFQFQLIVSSDSESFDRKRLHHFIHTPTNIYPINKTKLFGMILYDNNNK